MKIKRRSFGKKASLGLLGGATLLTSSNGLADPKPNPSNLKFAVQWGPSDELGMSMAQSMYVNNLITWTNQTDENLATLKQQADKYGMTIAYASACNNWSSIVLNLDDREKAIENFNNQTIALGKAGIKNRQIYFYTTGVLITHLAETPGGLTARAFSLNRPPDLKLSYQQKERPNRKYSPQEIWDNWEYFIKRAAPVAEDSDVRISIHPEDPPGIDYLDEPRVIASSFNGYKRALEIADSPNVGMCLCCGCVLEAGQERWGNDILSTIKYFGERKKIFKVHLRNVNSTLPEFHETWLEDGYYDMYKIMKALREVNNDTIISVDHWPGNRQGDYVRSGWFRCMSYATALLERANEEVG